MSLNWFRYVGMPDIDLDICERLPFQVGDAAPEGRHPWVTKLLGRMSAKQAAISIANKTARIAWAIMVKGGVYEAGHRAPQYRAEARVAAG
jgi:hypothetical protein